MKRGWMLFLAVMLGASVGTAATDSTAKTAGGSLLPGDLLVHTGMIGIADREAVDNLVSVEARWRHDWHRLRPWGGVTLVDSGAWFADAGRIYDVRLSRRLSLTLGTGPFYYTHEEEDDDLGFRLEFYSFVEAGWAWKRNLRVGLRIGHLSNAGLGRRNPGTETLSLAISKPFDAGFAAAGR